LAACSLVQLLRAAETMKPAHALVAESWVYSMLQSGPTFRDWHARHARAGRRSSPEDQPLITERYGPCLSMQLNRPEVHNAIDVNMRDALIDALRTVVADPSIAEVRISGRGRSFCSGGDLAEFGSAPDPVSAHVVRTSRSIGTWLSRCSERVTVELHGDCIGAGIELAAFAGQVRAAQDTRISLPETHMGLVPGAGGTVSITARIGRHRTAYLALSGEVISAATALDWGLVDELDPVLTNRRGPCP
jgi:enoyl-CoA hydratase/carnithine racemase